MYSSACSTEEVSRAQSTENLRLPNIISLLPSRVPAVVGDQWLMISQCACVCLCQEREGQNHIGKKVQQQYARGREGVVSLVSLLRKLLFLVSTASLRPFLLPLDI